MAIQLQLFTKLRDVFWRPAKSSEPISQPPMVPSSVPENELQTKAQALLRSVGAELLARKIEVKWNQRLRSTAGIAYPTRSKIFLNPRLREFGEEEVDRTLRHELAHLLAFERAHRRRIAPHGEEWKSACRELGLPDESRTHTLPLPRHKVTRKHLYRCATCAVEIGRVRPLRRGSACTVCCKVHNRGRYDARFRFMKIG